MVAEVPVIILLEKLQKLQTADERVRPPELEAEVVTAVQNLRGIFNYLRQRNITENLKGLLSSIYTADNTTESVLTTIQRRRKGVIEIKLLQEFKESFHKVFAEFNTIRDGLHDLENENVYPINDVSEREEGFQYDQELYVLTGREEEEKELVERLIQDGVESLRAIPLVSEEVLGKTALARAVYNKPVIRQYFQCRAWVHIPEDLGCKDLLLIILRRIPDCVLEGIELLGESELTATLVKSLMENRFLIVLDNVYKVDIWHMLARSFADATNGSRVILTTRFLDVARDADPWGSPMKLEPLTSQKSWEFFLKKIRREDNSDLNEFKDKILRVCKGLPATILLLGGLLSTIQLSEWAEIIDHVDVVEDQSSPLNIVDWSYHKLPRLLKPCFLYLASFPKAYEIPIRRLLHLWVAEGFVRISSQASDVNVAMKYFDELVRRNMIEIQRWKSDGTPKTCLMPCYLYDVFLPKAEDVGFLHVHHRKSDVCTSEDSLTFNIRRFAHQFGNDSSSKSHVKHLCSYVSFNKVNRSTREIARLLEELIAETGSSPLKVLDLEGVYKPMTAKNLGKLQNLRYISFRWTCLDSCPESIGYLPCLETLDLKHTNITTLPSSIWKAKNLRHLYMNEVPIPKPPKEPSTILQSLMGLFIGSKDPEKYGLNKFTGLRKLGMTCHSKSVEKTAFCISKLVTLQTLKLRSRDQFGQPLELTLSQMNGHPSLSNLYLFGVIMNLTERDLPRSLESLTLSMSGLKEDPMPVLGQLPKLNVLRLFAHSFSGSKMTCSADRPFHELRVLKLWNLEKLVEWTVEEGSMPKLRELEIRGCEVLTKSEGLEQLTALKELSLTNVPKGFVAAVKEIEMLKDKLVTNERKSSTHEYTKWL